MMDGSLLRFYIRENRRHHGKLLWEWLLEQGNQMGLRGGSAFRAIGGFGRHHHLYEDHFFELAGKTTVEVEFIVTAAEDKQLLALIDSEQLQLFYARLPAYFGMTATGKES